MAGVNLTCKTGVAMTFASFAAIILDDYDVIESPSANKFTNNQYQFRRTGESSYAVSSE